MVDNRWLEQRGQAWYAVKDVPRPLRKVLGKKRLIVSLQTRDLKEAQDRRHSALAEFAQEIKAVRVPKAGEPIYKIGMDWRSRLATDDSDEQKTAAGLEYERIKYKQGRLAADTFADIALGHGTPLLHYADAWLNEGGKKGELKPRTQSQYRADLVRFGEWLERQNIPATLEAVIKPIAGRFVTEELLAKGVDRATGNRRISAVSAYWRWLGKRTSISDNPWTGQSLARTAHDRKSEKNKRPFTTSEVATLLGGPADTELSDAMRLAALTGARIEELYRLKVGDCQGGWFNIREAKTLAGIRRIPIHSDLKAIVARRIAGKGKTDFLFHEPKTKPVAPKPKRDTQKPNDIGRERSSAMSKRFGRYRQSLGVEERDEGKRHSRIDFHSWRRWFVNEARNARIDRFAVAAVVGHKVGNLTDDVYAGTPLDLLLTTCVEAVRLPQPGTDLES